MRGLVKGKMNGKRRALSDFAVYCDGTPMEFGYPFGDGESKSGTSPFSGACLVDPVKPVENVTDFVRWDTYSRIMHLEYRFPISPLSGQGNGTAFVRVFDGIVDQVQKKLLEPQLVSDNRDRGILDESDVNPLSFRERFAITKYFVYQFS